MRVFFSIVLTSATFFFALWSLSLLISTERYQADRHGCSDLIEQAASYAEVFARVAEGRMPLGEEALLAQQRQQVLAVTLTQNHCQVMLADSAQLGKPDGR